jgi:hypothetical protein
MVFSSLLFLSQNAFSEELVLHTDHAFAVHLSTSGLKKIGEAIEKRLPNNITISAGDGSFECSSTKSLTYTLQDWAMDFIVHQIDFQREEETLFINILGYIETFQCCQLASTTISRR